MSGRTLRLQAGDPSRDALIVGKVVLVVSGEPVTLELTVPQGPVAFEDTLPILQGLTDLMAERGIAKVEAAGRTISCRAGCGACCRQLVPISQAEARALAAVVAAMPETQRNRARQRFDEVLQTLQASGLAMDIDAARQDSGSGLRDLGLRYFRQGVACPFLEDEACSIHPDRPLACREYLVTSPAVHCAAPSAATIDMVALPGKPSQALMLADGADSRESWMPLVYALAYADRAEQRVPTRSAPNILRDVITRLQGSPEGRT